MDATLKVNGCKRSPTMIIEMGGEGWKALLSSNLSLFHREDEIWFTCKALGGEGGLVPVLPLPGGCLGVHSWKESACSRHASHANPRVPLKTASYGGLTAREFLQGSVRDRKA